MTMATGWLDAFREDHLQSINASTPDRSSVEARIARMQGFRRPDTPGRLDLESTLDTLDWLRVVEIRKSDERIGEVATLTPSLIALSRLGRTCGYLVGGNSGEFTVCMGVEKGHRKLLRTAIDGAIEASAQDSLPIWLVRPSTKWASLIYSGVPSQRAGLAMHPDVSKPFSALDQTLRTLRPCGGTWLFMLLFRPVDAQTILAWQFSVAEQIRRVRIDYQQPGTVASFSRAAQHYEGLLDDYLELLELAIAEGGWLTYGAAYASPEAIQHVHAALAASLAGPHSRPEPWRLRPPGTGVFRIDSADWQGQLTFLPSSYLARMACLPEQEHSGIAVSKVRRFDLVPSDEGQSRKSPPEDRIPLGQIVDGSMTTEETFRLDLSVLSTHVFVAGITGSGKSTTVRTLVSQVERRGVKLLVIEPVKREYRQLDLSGLRVFSLGDPGCDLQLNPFAFEGVSCSTHLDHLKSLFAAAYVLYPPMPYILEQALYEVYRDKGWDFASGLNWRSQQRHVRGYPSLTDLYAKTSEVIARSGYGPRLEPEIRAALEVRINNMRIGAKGVLLDTSHSLTLEELVKQPTILELQGIGDPEQRAFLMGLILTKIYEGSIAAGPSERLRLVVVIEEAHRLLEERAGGGEDFANPQAKAIETFGDMLAELRAYGVGLIIAEQSPSRITRQVLKNTATKFAHQLVDADERELMAGSMVLTEDESQDLATLRCGHMLMFTQGMNRPMRVAVAAQGLASRTPYQIEANAADTTIAKLSAMKASLRDDLHIMRSTLRLISAWLFDDQQRQDMQDGVLALVRERMPVIESDQAFLGTLTVQLVKHNIDKIISQWGSMFGWSFEVEAHTGLQLGKYAEHALTRTESPSFAGGDDLLALMRAPRPLAGCRDCMQPCQYRPFVLYLDTNRLASAIGRVGQDQEDWQEVAWMVEEQVTTAVAQSSAVFSATQRCYLALALAQTELPRKQQGQVVSRVMLELESDQ